MQVEPMVSQHVRMLSMEAKHYICTCLNPTSGSSLLFQLPFTIKMSNDEE
jgi:hypothetical protein